MALFQRKAKHRAVAATEPSRHTASNNSAIAIRPSEADQYYLKESGNYFDLDDAQQLSELRNKLRNYAMYDDTLSIVINLCSMFVTSGARIQCDDSQNQERLQAFFEAQGFQQFLEDFVHEFFVSGEVTSFAYWSDNAKCFTEEQILDPDTVVVQPSIFTDDDHIVIGVPDNVREVLEDDTNPESYEARQELKVLYQATTSGKGLNVDSDKIIRMVNKARPWDLYGVPFFTPALSALAQKESLDAALYEQLQTLIVPTIIGEVGLRAGELGQGSQAWFPSQSELNEIRDTYRDLLMAKLRVGVFPIGVKWSNAFQGANIPSLDNDYRRCQTSILRCVAAGQGLLDGSAGGPFASNAINRDVFSSFLQSIRTKVSAAFQKRIDTAIQKLNIIAYTVPTDGEDAGKRVPVLDRQGNPVLEEAKLAFDDGVMRDANAILQTMLQLRNADVPISKDSLANASGLGLNVMEEVRKLNEERKAIDALNMEDIVDLSNNGDSDTDTGLSSSEVRSPLSDKA